MTKNIVICSDGTGNTFSQHVSNITHLIKVLELGEPAKQCVFYDQGLGTNPSLVAEVDSYRNEQVDNRRGLTILPKPGDGLLFCGFFGQLAALAFGYGLRQNVKEMYQALMNVYDEGDKVFLFGFSRGAFTVRVLAGLIYRCGLLPKGTLNFEQRFREAYELYEPHHFNQARVEHFKIANRVRTCEIHFLGLWDTVKAYGGVWPKSLPHLRYNPIVNTVRHALALDEHRSWFIPTSWGGIDSDDPDAQGVEPDGRYASQKVQEVWFRGCHSDVGGGDDEVKTARTPLRWMLSEAVAQGLFVTPKGSAQFAEGDASGIPVIHESMTRGWLFSEYLPRWELDNSTRPPKRFFKFGRSGKRNPLQFKRAGKVLLHASTREVNPAGIDYVSTIAVPIRHEA